MNKKTLENSKSTRAPAVVVGVDGSPGAIAALRWALQEARLRNTPVRAVHAWTFGYIGGYPYWGRGSSIGSYTGVNLNDLQRAAEGLLDRALADVEDEAEGIEIERRVIQGPAADVLVQAASPYDLLVVGSRGHGGFTGLMLGSVSQQCIHHAHCPVVVVRSSVSAARRPAAVAQTESPAAA